MATLSRCTLSQFYFLREESVRRDESSKLMLAEATRAAFHANRAQYSRWFKAVADVVSPKRKARSAPVIPKSDNDFAALGIEVKKDGS